MWQYEVVTAGSASQAVDALAGADITSVDIIVCDYRLRGEERGTDAVRRVHEVLGARG